MSVGDRDASPVDERRIVRQTRGGELRLVDLDGSGECAACGAGHNPTDYVTPIGIEFEGTRGPADGATLKTAICADCVSEAMAILFGRRHVQTGGDVGDLRSGAHRYGPPDDGLRYCEACGYAEAAVEGRHACSGIRGQLGPAT